MTITKTTILRRSTRFAVVGALALATLGTGAVVAGASGHGKGGTNGHNGSTHGSAAPQIRHGLVTAVSATSLTLVPGNSHGKGHTPTVTFTLNSSTVVNVGSTLGAAADLVKGDRVTVTTAANSNVATTVVIQPVSFTGKVTSIASPSFVLKQGHHRSKSVLTSSSTTFVWNGAAATFANLAVGDTARATGYLDPTTAGQIDALRVVFESPESPTTTSTTTTSTTTTTVAG
jgi:hypothetical protein